MNPLVLAAIVKPHAASYVGPLDLVSGAVVAYGQRALSAAKLGTALYTIRRDSDDAEQSFSSDAVTGDAPVSSIQTFIGSAFNQTGNVISGNTEILLVSATGVKVGQLITGTDIPANTYVTALSVLTITISKTPTGTNAAETLTFTRHGYATVYNDQSGNAKNLVQATAINQPTWIANQQNGKPGMKGNDISTAMLQAASSSTFTGAITAFMVCKGQARVGTVINDPTSQVDVFGGSSANVLIFENTNSCGGDYGSLLSDAAYHVIDAVCQFGQNDFLVDGVQLGVVNNDFDSGGALSSFSNPAYAGDLASDDFLLEWFIYSEIMSAGNRLALRQNIATYYGITLS